MSDFSQGAINCIKCEVTAQIRSRKGEDTMDCSNPFKIYILTIDNLYLKNYSTSYKLKLFNLYKFKLNYLIKLNLNCLLLVLVI